MERGILWSALLLVFVGLAWLGWQEYQKIQAYQRWAAQFDQAKYDIYAVLGQKGDRLTWGIPTAKGPINLQDFSLQEVETIRLCVDGQQTDLQSTPNISGRKITLRFQLRSDLSETKRTSIEIPFTEVDLAFRWEQHLQTYQKAEGREEQQAEDREQKAED
jgi:hypothetical protein